jgi:hypothetical protein
MDAEALTGVDSIITPTNEPAAQTRVEDLLPAREASEKKAGVTLAKVTLYVRPDQVISIEEIQLRERQKTGEKKDKSELVQEALDLLIEKYKA